MGSVGVVPPFVSGLGRSSISAHTLAGNGPTSNGSRTTVGSHPRQEKPASQAPWLGEPPLSGVDWTLGVILGVIVDITAAVTCFPHTS